VFFLSVAPSVILPRFFCDPLCCARWHSQHIFSKRKRKGPRGGSVHHREGPRSKIAEVHHEAAENTEGLVLEADATLNNEDDKSTAQDGEDGDEGEQH
jgi:hypothetical protein